MARFSAALQRDNPGSDTTSGPQRIQARRSSDVKPRSELAQRRPVRAVARLRLHAREFLLHDAARLGGLRPETELEVKPPRAGGDPVLVPVAELVRIEADGL